MNTSVDRAKLNEPDEELFLRYLSAREPADLEALISRYQHFAFRVALCVTGNEALAEEAAQNAFVQLACTKAAGEQGPVSFRAWLYRLVSNSALNLKRTERRSAMRSTSARFKQEASCEPAHADQKEVHTALREALGKLGEEQRMPVVLHYVDGLSQTEIANLVGVSVSQISRRIAQALEHLRRRLTEAGVAPAAMLPGLLSQQGWLDAPRGLQQALANLAARRSLPSLPVSRRLSHRVLPKARSAAPIAAATFAIVAVGAMFACFTSSPSPASKPKKPELPPARVAATGIPVPSPEPVPDQFKSITWTFENGLPPGLKLLQGEWKWFPNPPLHDPCMVPGQTEATAAVIHLPLEIPSQPVVIRCKLWMPRAGLATFGILFHQHGQDHYPLKAWHKPLSKNVLGKDMTRLVLGELYCLDRYTIHCYEGKPFVVHEYNRPYGHMNVCLKLKTWVVTEISVHPLEAQEIPRHLRNIEAVIRGLGVPPMQIDEKGRERNPDAPTASGQNKDAAKEE